MKKLFLEKSGLRELEEAIKKVQDTQWFISEYVTDLLPRLQEENQHLKDEIQRLNSRFAGQWKENEYKLVDKYQRKLKRYKK